MNFVCVHQIELPHIDDPRISVEMYDLAINLIQSFDEMEGKESRWGLSIMAHLTSLTQTHNNYHVSSCLSSKADKGGGFTSSERGSVLVFLPGIHEISHMHEALAKLVHKR